MAHCFQRVRIVPTDQESAVQRSVKSTELCWAIQQHRAIRQRIVLLLSLLTFGCANLVKITPTPVEKAAEYSSLGLANIKSPLRVPVRTFTDINKPVVFQIWI